MAFLRSKKVAEKERTSAHSFPTDGEVLNYDIRGQICPSTLLTALQEINLRKNELKNQGMILSFHTDNRDAIATIPEAARNMGYQVEVSKQDGAYVLFVRASPE